MIKARNAKPDAWLPLMAFPGALIAGLLVLAAVQRTFPVPVENSAPRIIYHGRSFTVEMDVTNHTKIPVSEVVGMMIGTHYASRYGEGINPLDKREITVSLAASEVKHVRCEFPNTYRRLPDSAEARVLR